MPENPLLPNKRLQEMLELMQRCYALDRKLAKRPVREAMLAATTIHLLSGDIVSSDAADATAKAIAPASKANALAENKSVEEPASDVALPKISRLALAAAMAQGLRSSGTGGIVLAFVTAGTTEAGWAEALTYAQHAQLPLLVACADPSSGRGSSSAMTYGAVTKLAKKLKLPVLPVDGEDAVAVYRVMQECTLRARVGEGPAVMWCMLTPGGRAKLSRSAQPIARMEAYLSVRGLLPKKPAKAKLK